MRVKKQLTLKTLPDILIVHLKRFQYTDTYRDKITSVVEFPLTDLDMSAHLSSEVQKENVKYNLYGISVSVQLFLGELDTFCRII